MPGSLARTLGINLGILLALAGAAAAQSIPEQGSGAAAPGTVDCTEAEVDYTADPAATREETIASMDRALFRSLSKFDACQTPQAGAAGGGGASGGGGADGSGGAAGGGGSVASSDMSGEEASASRAGGDGQGVDWSTPPAEAGETDGARQPAGPVQSATRPLANGKVPDDIPPADNDSVLEAQIRQAAINETDPAIKAKLWNEYRKYKGLPQAN